MSTREAAIGVFLDAVGWGGAAMAPLAGDASNRRYLRLSGPDGAPAVLMDAPPERGEDVRPFVAMTRLLRGAGLSAPAILAADEAAGFLLLEDLGDGIYARLCEADPGAEGPLYSAAVDLLAGPLAGLAPQGLAPYDAGVLMAEAGLMGSWYLPAALGADPGGAGDEIAGRLAEALSPVAGARAVPVLRDYHAENLLWLPERAGHARVGLLDYQDALAGHPAYDLVSLLEDARRDTSPELRTAMTGRFLAARPELDPDAFRAGAAVLAAQRNLKILGIFARLALRDGKPRYLGLLPRVWGHLCRDLAHPSLAALRRAVEAAVPAPEPAVRARIAALAAEASAARAAPAAS